MLRRQLGLLPVVLLDDQRNQARLVGNRRFHLRVPLPLDLARGQHIKGCHHSEPVSQEMIPTLGIIISLRPRWMADLYLDRITSLVLPSGWIHRPKNGRLLNEWDLLWKTYSRQRKRIPSRILRHLLILSLLPLKVPSD